MVDTTEQGRVQLAGILVAAEGNAVGSKDCLPGEYGWSPAFEEVKKLWLWKEELAGQVKFWKQCHREQRERASKAEAEAERLRALLNTKCKSDGPSTGHVVGLGLKE